MKYLGIIILCLLILFMLYINTIIVEGAESNGVSMSNAGDQISIKNIEDMRAFLEKMYMICILNPNDQTNNVMNTNSYKISILGTYLWPALGPFVARPWDELSPMFGGASTAPKSMIKTSAEESKTEVPPVPILNDDIDYASLVDLALLGKIIMSFSTNPFNTGKSTTIWFKGGKKGRIGDFYRHGGDRSWGQTVNLSNIYLTKITYILGYFHGQIDRSNSVHIGGDTQYTRV